MKTQLVNKKLKPIVISLVYYSQVASCLIAAGCSKSGRQGSRMSKKEEPIELSPVTLHNRDSNDYPMAIPAEKKASLKAEEDQSESGLRNGIGENDCDDHDLYIDGRAGHGNTTFLERLKNLWNCCMPNDASK